MSNNNSSHSRNSDPDPDSDLADLLGHQGTQTPPLSGPGNSTSASMNLDHLTTAQVSVTQQGKSPSGKKKSHGSQGMSLCAFVWAYISMQCHYYPRCCGGMVAVFMVASMFMLGNLILNPVEQLGVINHNHFNIKSKYDLSIGQIDHWCLRGGNDRCACEDPLQPLDRLEHLSWVEAVKANRKSVQQYRDNPVDVAILGESVVEAMGGRWMGLSRSLDTENLGKMFRKYFQNPDEKDGIKGVALGVAGDTAPNVLWRLLHGEMPDYFQPKIWWISLGMNDLARMECSEEVVVLGILRVVEEILEKRPKSRIVINSLLPMAHVRGGAYPLVSDYGDAFDFPSGGLRSRFRRDPTNEATPVDAPPVGNRRVLQEGKKQKNRGDDAIRSQATGTRPRTADATTSMKYRADGTARSQTIGTRQRTADGTAPMRNRADGTPRSQTTGTRQRTADVTAAIKKREQEEAQQAEAVEQLRDAKYRKKKRPEPVDAVLSNRKRIRKYPIGGDTFNRLPLWTSIRAINKQLRTFAEEPANKKRVYFFDATDIFVDRSSGRDRVRSGLITLVGYPRPRGFQLWEERIINYSKDILEDMKRTNPELFGSTPVLPSTDDVLDDDESEDDQDTRN